MTPSQEVMGAILGGRMLRYTRKPTNGTWVAEGMADFLRNQNNYAEKCLRMSGVPTTPILIKAPTGTGKTTFIINDLAEAARKNSKDVLVFVNRIALGRQLLNDYCTSFLRYSYSSDSMNGMDRVGNLIVLTYQQFAGELKAVLIKLNLPPNIQYVVMDEAHFFTSDASFNYQTPNILENILLYSYDKQRIYMSATPEDVKNIIAYEEFLVRDYYLHRRERMLLIQEGTKRSTVPITPNELYEASEKHKYELDRLYNSFPNSILEYDFPPRPYNANVKFFSCWETIIEAVTKMGSKEQWLIFVASKDDGTFLEKKLNKISVFVNADNRSRELEQIEQTGTFTQKVLITTSVLDNGVSIKNDNLRNIVIDSSDSVQFHQMLGRKRIKDNEAINIYVRNNTKDDIESYIQSNKVKIRAIQDFEKNPDTFIAEQYDSCPCKELFVYDLRYNMRFNNKYLLHCLGRKNDEYIRLQVKLYEDKNAFAKEVCSWVGVDFREDMIISDNIFDKAWKEIDMIIQSHSEPFDRTELDRINDDIVKITERIGRGYGFVLKGDKLPNDINKNLRVMAENGYPLYSIKKANNKFLFVHKGEAEKAADESSD